MTREHLHLMARVATAIYRQDNLEQNELDALFDEVEKLVREVERLRDERVAAAHLFRSIGLSLMAQAVENGEHLKVYADHNKGGQL